MSVICRLAPSRRAPASGIGDFPLLPPSPKTSARHALEVETESDSESHDKDLGRSLALFVFKRIICFLYHS